MRSLFICPVCARELERGEKVYSCPSGHSFDISKQGYVNLLLSQSSSAKRHGDDRLMVRARRDFLEKGYYSTFRETLCSAVIERAGEGSVILDAGCGEGYYTSRVTELAAEKGISAAVCGVDISKDAVAYAAKRKPGFETAVAGVFSMPVRENSVDIIMNVFAPLAAEEYLRVLKDGGYLVRAIPLERHLMGLKEKIYDSPRVNSPEVTEIKGFDIVDRREIKETIVMDNNEDIMRLFMMTPYYYKTGISDQKKIETLSSLATELEFAVLIYKKTE